MRMKPPPQRLAHRASAQTASRYTPTCSLQSRTYSYNITSEPPPLTTSKPPLKCNVVELNVADLNVSELHL
jgi:hypothetical protein